MSLFQKSVIKKYVNGLDQAMVDEKFSAFQHYFGDRTRQENIRNSKEEQIQEGFFRELFVNVPGYELTDSSNNLGKVWINDRQYFGEVQHKAWEFYIGGYQPAQKWLKDRKGRQLTFDDIRHYQKIIIALTETDRLMKEIDEIKINS